MKFIRWSGIALLLAIALTVFLLTHFFMGQWIKDSIHTTGSVANGATVSVSDSSIDWLNSGLKLNNLEFADPNDLMINRLQVKDLEFQLDIAPLLKGQLHVEKLLLNDLLINEPRKVEAKKFQSETVQVWEGWAKDQVSEAKDIDASEALAKFDIRSPKAFESYYSQVKQTKARWENARKTLPTEEDLQAHSVALKEATDALKKAKGFEKIEATKQIKKVTKAIKKDKETLRNFIGGVRQDTQKLQQQYGSLQTMVIRDSELAMSVLKLTPEGIQHLAAQLLGEETSEWLMLVVNQLDVLKRLSGAKQEDAPPDLSSRVGVDVSFSEEVILPFYIKDIELGGNVKMNELQGRLTGKGQNFAPLLLPGKPLTLNANIALEKQSGAPTAEVGLSVSHFEDSKTPIKMSSTLKSWPFKDWGVMNHQLSLKEGMMDVDFKAEGDTSSIDVSIQLQLVDFKVDLSEKTNNSMAGRLASILEQQKKLDLTIELELNQKATKLKVRSNIDNLLYSQVKNELKAKADKTRRQVERQIQEQLAPIKTKIESELESFTGFQRLVESQYRALDDLKLR